MAGQRQFSSQYIPINCAKQGNQPKNCSSNFYKNKQNDNTRKHNHSTIFMQMHIKNREFEYILKDAKDKN